MACACVFRLCIGDLALPLGAVQTGAPAFKLIERRFTLCDETFAPLLQALETVGFACGDLAAGRKRGTDWLGVDVAHQLPDILPLARGTGATAYVPGVADCIGEALGQIERVQLGVLEPDKGFSQVLCCVSCALALALAGSLLEIVVFHVVRHHGVGSAGLLQFCLITWSNKQL